MSILVNGIVLNVVRGSNGFYYLDSPENRGVACSHHKIPSKEVAGDRTFTTGGNTYKYL